MVYWFYAFYQFSHFEARKKGYPAATHELENKLNDEFLGIPTQTPLW